MFNRYCYVLTPIIIFILTFSKFSFPSQDYEITLADGVQVDDRNYEFDVIIKSKSANLELTSYQCSLNFNNNIINEGELEFSFINETSGLNNPPSLTVGVYENGENAVLTFAALPGSDLIGENEIKLGRFRLSNTKTFNEIDPGISWNFEGDITTILTGSGFTDITNPDYHLSSLGNISGIDEATEPGNFELQQNYPNPFNPVTKIKYAIGSSDGESGKLMTTLKVFDILGREAAVLVNEEKPAGNYEIEFDASFLPSGVYFYKLNIKGEAPLIRKMVLLK